MTAECPTGRREALLFSPTEGWTLSGRAPPSLSGLAGDTHTYAASSPETGLRRGKASGRATPSGGGPLRRGAKHTESRLSMRTHCSVHYYYNVFEYFFILLSQTHSLSFSRQGPLNVVICPFETLLLRIFESQHLFNIYARLKYKNT